MRFEEIIKKTAEKKELTIATHEGVFHADEVTAIALLKTFFNDILNKIGVNGEQNIRIKIHRVNHQTPKEDLNKFDLIIDIGGQYDGEKFFDHHQWSKEENPHAAAGLVWERIKKTLGLEEKYYTALNELIEIIDAADIGVRPSGKFEFPALIARFNGKNIYGPEQEKAFEKAVSFAEEIISSLKEEAEEIKKAEEIAQKAFPLKEEGLPEVIQLPEFNRMWSYIINGKKTPGIEAVIWQDKDQGNWKAQVVPIEQGSFQRVGKGFEPDTTGKMSFVHPGKFFCVAPTREILIDYLKKHFK